MAQQTTAQGGRRRRGPSAWVRPDQLLKRVVKWGDVIITIIFFLFVVWFGLFLIYRQQTKPETALMWAFACLGVGSLGGFLFGIPRVLQGDNAAPPSPNSPATGGGASGAASAAADARRNMSYSMRVNTNLEQISDWLTKIIVGLGLVELQNIPGHVRRLAYYAVADGFDPPNEKFAAALLIYFTVAGFIGGYMLTRLWLAGAFGRADVRTTDDVLSLTVEDRASIQVREFTLDDNGRAGLAAIDTATARRASSVSLDALSEPDDIAIWAKSKSAVGDYASAVEGYRRAVGLAPHNIRYRLEYAAALYYAHHPLSEAREQLIEAHTRLRVTPGVDPELKKNVYRSLTFQSLYVEPPVGFSDAVKYGEEFFAETGGGQPSGSIATNLAAAYGQQFRWLQGHDGPTEELKTARDNALKYVRVALATGGMRQERLRMLLLKDYPGKDSKENDLEVFEHDPEFREALSLPPATPNPGTA